MGFSIMLSKFNIFRHVLSRKDIGKSLIAVYKDANMSGFRNLPYSNYYWTIKLDYIELVLSQKEILSSLTLAEKVELLSEAKKKFSEKIANESFSSLHGIQFSIRIMVNILNMEKYLDSNLLNDQTIITLIQTGLLSDTSLINEIIRITDDYINNKK